MAQLAASTPPQTRTAPASWARLGRSASTAAARPRAATGWSSNSSEDTAAGSLGSDAVMNSHPTVWLVNESSSSHLSDGHGTSRRKPPNTRPSSSDPSAAVAVTSTSGPAICGVPAEVWRKMSRKAV